MQTYIISAEHEDETGRFWAGSNVKRTAVTLQDGETIHQAIARILESEDYVTMAYKGKPQGNVYRDKKDGTSYIVGYHYRTKHYIEDRSENIQKENVPFTTWVTIHGLLVEPELEDVESN